MSKTTKRTQPKLDHAEKAVDQPELEPAKAGDLLTQVKKGRWTAAEDQFLRDNAGKLTSREIGTKLGRSHESTRKHASNIGVSLQLKTPTLVDLIKPLASKMSTAEIAKKLNTSQGNIRRAASGHGISLIRKDKLWTREQDNYLRKNSALLTAAEIGRVIGRSKAAVTQRATNIGISLAKHHRPHHQVNSLKSQKTLPLKFKDLPLPDDCR